MNKHRDKGFTLIELLIVIVILGILAAVTVFAVGGITDRGQENACAIEKRTLETAISAFNARSASADTYPENLVDLAPYVGGDITGLEARFLLNDDGEGITGIGVCELAITATTVDPDAGGEET